jgi:hypothetical protein
MKMIKKHRLNGPAYIRYFDAGLIETGGMYLM